MVKERALQSANERVIIYTIFNSSSMMLLCKNFIFSLCLTPDDFLVRGRAPTIKSAHESYTLFPSIRDAQGKSSIKLQMKELLCIYYL